MEAGKRKGGLTILITGLSASGKSTLAEALYAELVGTAPGPVALLDGDVVRKHWSPDLGFSREDREANLRRMALAAREIIEKGGIAICSFIAPYEDSRREIRHLLSHYGGYVEVYLSTPLKVCERRDPKGLYARARKGLIRHFTGIDDPYEVPRNPEITIDTTSISPKEAVGKILVYLHRQGYVGL